MSTWAHVIGNLFDEMFSRKLLASLAGIAGIVILVVVLAESLGAAVITETTVLAAVGAIVSITLYQVTREVQSTIGKAKIENGDE